MGKVANLRFFKFMIQDIRSEERDISVQFDPKLIEQLSNPAGDSFDRPDQPEFAPHPGAGEEKEAPEERQI